MSERIHRRYQAGEVIFREGEIGDCAYVIERGAVEVFVTRHGVRIPLAVRRAGDIFGEMGIVDQTPRSASVRAIEPCELMVLSEAQIGRRIAELDPVLRMVLQVVLQRFRETIRGVGGVSDDADADAAAAPRAPSEAADHSAAIDRIAFEQTLQAAFEERQFFLCFQPIVAARSGETLGFEALMRWRHPKRGVLPPGEFIEVVEESGVLRDMTLWAIDAVCQLLTTPLSRAGLAEDFFIGVNVSASDLCNEGFFEAAREILAKRGVAPGRLVLELTESQLAANAAAAARMMARYKAIGVSISVDDFGTGYSNLGYLAQYPVDHLKIDRSFVQAMDRAERDLNLVRAIIELAHILGMMVVAEGVETPAQQAILAAAGCDKLQGFYFSKPVPWEEAIA